MASATKNVLGKSTGKDDEANRIAKLVSSESISKTLAAAQVEGGEGLTVDAPGAGRKNSHGIIKS